MLKREHFKQVYQEIVRLEEMFSRTLGQGKQRADSIGSTIHQRISQHTGKVILLMLVILIVGTVGVILQRKRMREGQEKIAGEQLLNRTRKIGSRLTKPIISGIDQQLDVLTLEHQLEQLIRKDSLTSEDSAFLWQLNEYINEDSLFRAHSRWMSLPTDVAPMDIAPTDVADRALPLIDSSYQKQ